MNAEDARQLLIWPGRFDTVTLMKRRGAAARKPTTKNKPGPESVDEYFVGVSEPGRSVLKRLRTTIRFAVPPETTETISYGIPAFNYHGTLVYYAAFAHHCSLFPGSAALLTTFKDELKGYRTSKGTIQFPLDKPLPTALIKRIVRARVAQKKPKQRS